MVKKSVLCLMIAVCVFSATATHPDDTTAAHIPDTGDVLEPQKTAAAVPGVRWLMPQKDAMPPVVAVTTYRKIYKVTSDQALAEELLEITREIEPTLPHVDTAIDIHDRDSRRWHNLRPVLTEIVRKRCAREECETDVEAIQELHGLYWGRLFPGSMNLSQKLVAVHLMNKLGIGGEGLYDSVVSEIRSHVDLLEDAGTYTYLFYLYALTHIILTDSGYYDRYSEPSGFGLEIGAFRKALDDLLQADDMTSTEMDIAAEILICLKLLRLPAEKRVEMMYRSLMEHQNPDGSWGSGPTTDSAKIHNTAVATIALFEFAPSFRGGDIHCDTATYP